MTTGIASNDITDFFNSTNPSDYSDDNVRATATALLVRLLGDTVSSCRPADSDRHCVLVEALDAICDLHGEEFWDDTCTATNLQLLIAIAAGVTHRL
jgi:hypothetical protein